MTDPFLPPSAPLTPPMERVPGYWSPPTVTPPEPPKRKHRGRKALLIGGGIIAGIVVISVATNPDATKDGFAEGIKDAPKATQAPVETQAPVVTAEAPEAPVVTLSDVPAWVNDETYAWSAEIADLMNDTSDLSSDMVSALERTDIAEATDIAQELHLMWVTAPEVPAGVPIASEYNALRDSAVDSFGTVADALIELDATKMQQATIKMGHTTDLINSFTDEIVSMTEQLGG